MGICIMIRKRKKGVIGSIGADKGDTGRILLRAVFFWFSADFEWSLLRNPSAVKSGIGRNKVRE